MAEFDPNVTNWQDVVRNFLTKPRSLDKRGVLPGVLPKAGTEHFLKGIGSTLLDFAQDAPTISPLKHLPGGDFVIQGLENIKSQYLTAPEPETFEEKQGAVIGPMLPYFAAGHISRPLAIQASKALAQRGAPKVLQVLGGELAQEAAFAPSSYRQTEGDVGLTALYSGASVLLGGMFGGAFGRGAFKKEVTEKVAIQALDPEIAGTLGRSADESPELVARQMADNKIDTENLEISDLVRQTTPPEQWSEIVADTVADNNPKIIESYGESVKVKTTTADQLPEDLATEVYTADGPISSQLAIQDRATKAFLDLGQTTPSSVLDEIRPSASLGERKYILLNGDWEVFADVSRRFGTPERKILEIIERARALPLKDRGQNLFASIVDQAEIAKARGDVDTFQVPRKSENWEMFKGKLAADEAEARKYYNPSDRSAEAATQANSPEMQVRVKKAVETVRDLGRHIAGEETAAGAEVVRGASFGDIPTASIVKDKQGGWYNPNTREVALWAGDPELVRTAGHEVGHDTIESASRLAPQRQAAYMQEHLLKHKLAHLHAIENYTKLQTTDPKIANDLWQEFNRKYQVGMGGKRPNTKLSADKLKNEITQIMNRVDKLHAEADKHAGTHEWFVNADRFLQTVKNASEASPYRPEGSGEYEDLISKGLPPDVISIPHGWDEAMADFWKNYLLDPRNLTKKSLREVDELFVPSNQLKNAGKVLTTPAQEGSFKLEALNSATDPNLGAVPKEAQEILNSLGPVATKGTSQLLEGAGPFYKDKLLKAMAANPPNKTPPPSAPRKGKGRGGKPPDKITLRDYFEAFKTLRASMMLTGVTTHLANGLSGAYRSSIGAGVTTLAAAADVAKVATGLQRGRKVYFGEALAQLEGQFSTAFGLGAALPTALREFAHEIRGSKDLVNTLIDPTTGKEINAVGRLLSAVPNKTLSKVGGFIGAAVQAPFSLLRSVDNYFFDVNFTGNMYKLAYAKVAAEGKSFTAAMKEISENLQKRGEYIDVRKQLAQEQGEAFGTNPAEIAEISQKFMLDPSTIPADITEAKRAAERTIFVAKEGGRLDAVLDMLDKADNELGGLVSLVLPFRRTPANIIREGMRESPLGFPLALASMLGKEPVEFGSREMSMRLGQAAFGTLAFYVLWQNVLNGNLRGDPVNYEPSKARRDTNQALGQRPGSLYVKFGADTYTVPLDRLQPIGSTLQTLIQHKSDLDAAKDAGIDTVPLEDRAAALSMDLIQNLGVGDFSRNLGDFLEAVNSEDGPAKKRYLNALGASLVPAGIKQYLAGQNVPYTRPATEDPAVIGGIKASVGAGTPKVGLFGTTDRHVAQGLGFEVAAGGSIGKLANDPVTQKMAEVGAYHTAPDIIPELKDLTSKQQVEFQIGKGKLQKQYVERVVLNPGFAGLAPEAQKRIIDREFRKASELANKRAKALLKLKGIISEKAISTGRI